MSKKTFTRHTVVKAAVTPDRSEEYVRLACFVAILRFANLETVSVGDIADLPLEKLVAMAETHQAHQDAAPDDVKAALALVMEYESRMP